MFPATSYILGLIIAGILTMTPSFSKDLIIAILVVGIVIFFWIHRNRYLNNNQESEPAFPIKSFFLGLMTEGMLSMQPSLAKNLLIAIVVVSTLIFFLVNRRK
jgi:uncharacterized membrane protein